MFQQPQLNATHRFWRELGWRTRLKLQGLQASDSSWTQRAKIYSFHSRTASRHGSIREDNNIHLPPLKPVVRAPHCCYLSSLCPEVTVARANYRQKSSTEAKGSKLAQTRKARAIIYLLHKANFCIQVLYSSTTCNLHYDSNHRVSSNILAPVVCHYVRQTYELLFQWLHS